MSKCCDFAPTAADFRMDTDTFGLQLGDLKASVRVIAPPLPTIIDFCGIGKRHFSANVVSELPAEAWEVTCLTDTVQNGAQAAAQRACIRYTRLRRRKTLC